MRGKNAWNWKVTSDKETSFVEKAILFDKKYSTYSSKRQKVCFLTKTHFFLVSYLPLNITHTTCCKIFSITSRQYVEKDIFFAPTDVFCIGFQPRAGKLSDDGERKTKFRWFLVCSALGFQTVRDVRRDFSLPRQSNRVCSALGFRKVNWLIG